MTAVNSSGAEFTSKSGMRKASKYNWLVPVQTGGGVLYNAFTGACLDVDDEDFRRISTFLNDESGINFASLGERAVELGGALMAGGFVVDSELDEFAAMMGAARAEKDDGGALVLTISPTFACNLACDYCFVGKKQGNMSIDTERKVIDFVAAKLTPDIRSMSVDWFGGEPLLACASIERLSRPFLQFCAAKSIPYRAQVTTNGTLITPAVVERLQSCGVDRLQISIDGTEATHDSRRPSKSSKRRALPVLGQNQRGSTSFKDTIRGVEAALGRIAIRLRVNVDSRNIADAMGLLSLFESRGWLRPENNFYPYLALVRDYTDAARVSWRISEDPGSEAFYDVFERWLDVLNSHGIPVAQETLYGFPEARALPCSAFTPRGWIINDDGVLHKCGLDLDTDELSIGTLDREVDAESPNASYWAGDLPLGAECRDCRALPVCLGGCARDRRENRTRAVADNCEYHLKYEPRILAHHIRLKRESARSLRSVLAPSS